MSQGFAPPWTVSVSLADGEHVSVSDNGSAPLSLMQVAGSGPAVVDFAFNSATPAADEDTAQVNAFEIPDAVHRWLVGHGFAPTIPPVTVRVNQAGSCNGFYFADPPVISLYAAGCYTSPCRNRAYSSWLVHEYGHHIHFNLPLINDDGHTSNSAFAEGLADSVSSLFLGDSRFGYRTFVCPDDPNAPCSCPGEPNYPVLPCTCLSPLCVCGAIRDPVVTNVQYPACPTQPPCINWSPQQTYYWAQLLSGVWWDIRSNIGQHDAIESFVAWTQMTVGGVCDFALQTAHKFNSAHPATLLEVLVLDDDDGDLSNGTPNYLGIARAFRSHNIYLPCLAATACEYCGDGPHTCPTPCACVIGQPDLAIILAAFGTSVGDPNYNPRADLNLDGHVGQAELGCVLQAFGTTCRYCNLPDCPSTVPSPPPCGN